MALVSILSPSTAGETAHPKSSGSSDRGDGSASPVVEVHRLKGRLNATADNVLAALRATGDPAMLDAVLACAQTTGKPVVRREAFAYGFDFVAQHAVALVADQGQLEATTSFALVALTDVWSAVRKVAGAKLGVVLSNQPQALHNHFVAALAGVYDGANDGPWQAQEGAVLGMLAVFRSIADRFDQGDAEAVHAQSVPLLAELSAGWTPLLFRALAHEQSTIRRYAVKCFRELMSACPDAVTVETFDTVVAFLEEPATSATAAGAEGMLSLLVLLLKALPFTAVADRWPVAGPVVMRYVGHSASTVRQAASLAFRVVAKRDRGDLRLTRGLLCDLASADDGQDGGKPSWQTQEGVLLGLEAVLSQVSSAVRRAAFPHDWGFRTLRSLQHAGAGAGGGGSGGGGGSPQSRASASSLVPGIPSPRRRPSLAPTPAVSLPSTGGDDGINNSSDDNEPRLPSLFRVSGPHIDAHGAVLEAIHLDVPNSLPDGGDSLPSMGTILRRVFVAVLACAAGGTHQQWEVRRMVDQIIPKLTETACWTNARILDSVRHWLVICAIGG